MEDLCELADFSEELEGEFFWGVGAAPASSSLSADAWEMLLVELEILNLGFKELLLTLALESSEEDLLHDIGGLENTPIYLSEKDTLIKRILNNE